MQQPVALDTHQQPREMATTGKAELTKEGPAIAQ
jgi:hypothetical protein